MTGSQLIDWRGEVSNTCWNASDRRFHQEHDRLAFLTQGKADFGSQRRSKAHLFFAIVPPVDLFHSGDGLNVIRAVVRVDLVPLKADTASIQFPAAVTFADGFAPHRQHCR